MDEARASWNTVYLDKNGFECQLTLRDEDEANLAQRVAAVTASILEGGGTPIKRRGNGHPESERANNGNGDQSLQPASEKTYVDRKGIRRCNLKLNNGKRCNQSVTEKEGRYGLFWSCPEYKEHAPPPDR